MVPAGSALGVQGAVDETFYDAINLGISDKWKNN